MIATIQRYAMAALAVLAVAAVMSALFFRGRAISAGARADAAEIRAATSEAQLQALKAAEDANATASSTARASADTRASEHNERARRVEGYAHDPQPLGADGCPDPDPRLSAELQDGDRRIAGAEGRLRDLRRPAPRTPARP